MAHEQKDADQRTPHYVASEHGGLETNPMSDGGHAPEVVPNSHRAYEEEKSVVSDPYSSPARYEFGTGYGNASPPQQHAAYGYPPSVPSGGYGYYSPAAPAGASMDEKQPRQLFGIARKQALAIVAIVVLAIVCIAVGIGVGVGVGARKNSSATPSSTTSDGGTPTSSAAPTSTEVGCPGANNFRYTTANNKTFIRYCGIDFGDNGEAKNINSVKTTTMTACIEACSAFNGCTGAGWGYLGGDQNNLHNCYMKSNLTHSHLAVSGWHFAVLTPNNLTKSDLSGGGSKKR